MDLKKRRSVLKTLAVVVAILSFQVVVGQTKVSNSTDTNAILPDGKYRFDIAFAEWEGRSIGEMVTVIIQGDSIQVIYEGDGSLTAEKGEVLDEGIIMKHKSGSWIIGMDPGDPDLDEVGGCSGGPAIIDFRNMKYWMC